MRSSILALPFLIALASPPVGLANDIYVSQNGSNTNGSTATNAASSVSVTWLNAQTWQQASLWGANGIHPGDTVHLTGVISNPLTIFFSGLPGSNVTILFESNAMLSAPTLPSSSCWLNCGGMSNLVIDGGVNGLIQCTDNGTPAIYTNPQGAQGASDFTNYNMQGIYAMPANNFTVQNLTISNLYNRLISSDDPVTGIWKARAIQLEGNNVTISNNTIYNTEDAIDFTYTFPASSNLVVVGNTIMGFNHGIVVGAGSYGAAPLFYNALIRSNTINGMDYYESTNSAVGGFYHRDPIFLFCTAVNTNNFTPTNDPCSYYIGCISNVDVSCNIIGPGVNPQTSSAGSAGIFMHDYSTNQMIRVLIYNNILTLTPPLEWGDGFICAYCVGGAQNIIANNTMVAWHTNITGGGVYYPGEAPIEAGQNFLVVNNIMMDGTPGMLLWGQPTTNCFTGFGTTNQPYVAGFYSGYNVFSTGGKLVFDEGCPTCFGTSGSTFQQYYMGTSGLAQWQALGPNYDSTSTVLTPSLSASYQMALGSVGAAFGTNLSAFFTTDVYGSSRPSTGPWDVGAIVAFTTIVALAPPTNLRVIQAE
jgi:hypothetical protein